MGEDMRIVRYKGGSFLLIKVRRLIIKTARLKTIVNDNDCATLIRKT